MFLQGEKIMGLRNVKNSKSAPAPPARAALITGKTNPKLHLPGTKVSPRKRGKGNSESSRPYEKKKKKKKKRLAGCLN